jgi:uncharacterized protein YjbI with pentapeptide repeats
LPTNWILVDGYLIGPGADLEGADLTGANLTSADLTGVTSGLISNPPASLPTNWILVDGYLIGPGADLTDAELNGADLRDADLTGVIWSNTTCPDGTNSDTDGDTCINDLG